MYVQAEGTSDAQGAPARTIAAKEEKGEHTNEGPLKIATVSMFVYVIDPIACFCLFGPHVEVLSITLEGPLGAMWCQR